MKRFFSLAIAIVLMLLPTSALFSQAANPLAGIWVNASRFVEIANDGRLRVVLKPYYAFVYEDEGWLPFRAEPLDLGLSAGGASSSASSPAYLLSILYARDKKEAAIPVSLIDDALYLRFYQKVPYGANVPAGATAAGTTAPSGSNPLDGFWVSAGNADAIRLYRSDAESEFFCYYFAGADYYRIRYWSTDARPKSVEAKFTGRDGTELSVPKFVTIAGTLYTCVTSTGKILRNYESGTFASASGALTFKPSAVVFAGTAAAVREPLKYALSADGTVLALGEPYLVRSKVIDLSSEIKAHNALRRPPRKPIFGFMKLDFHWDEIEKIRNNGVAPTEGK